MKVYTVHLSQRAQEFIDKLDKHLSNSITKRLKKLENNPIPSTAVFICREGNDKIFRFRIGNYRSLYKIKENQKIILISKIDKRPRIYHR